MNVNEYFRLARHKLGEISESELARQLEITTSFMAMIKQGQRTFPNHVVFILVHILDLDPAWLWVDVASQWKKVPKRHVFWKALAAQAAHTEHASAQKHRVLQAGVKRLEKV